MLIVLSEVYHTLLKLKADPENPRNMPYAWSRGRRQQHSHWPRESKYEGFDEFTPVVQLCDYLRYGLRYVGETCTASRALVTQLEPFFAGECAHIGEELDAIADAWGVKAGKLLAAAIEAVETDIAELGQAVLDGHVADAKKDVRSFLSGVGAASDELEKGDAAVVLEHVLTGTAAVETLYPGLDQDIEMVEAKLAELMTRRHERDALKTAGKRLREHVAPLAAAEGVFKRAK